jgi:TldD protein
VYAYTNNTSREALLKLASDASQAVKASIKGEINIQGVITLDRSERLNYADKVIIPPWKAEKKDIVQRLRAASAVSYGYDALVTQTSDAYHSVVQDVFIANSNGLWAEDKRVRTRISVQAVASLGNEKQTSHFSPGAVGGYELVDTFDIERLAKEAARIATTMLKADLCPSGKMPVIIDNAFGGVIFHEACAHSLEATSVAKKASVFADKLGEKIAADCVNAIDDGTLQGEWGTLNIDDEGGKPRRNAIN